MSGHSKWANIKGTKGVADARRAAIFTKLSREIMVAARQGGSDPDANFRLRLAVQRARDHNMPGDNIQRAIKKGMGELEGEALHEVTYEGYGPGGVAILVEAVTDNRNRTASEVRNVFTRAGAAMAEAGSVAWQFELRGLITIPAKSAGDEVALLAIDAGADDVRTEGAVLEVYTDPHKLEAVRRSLEASKVAIASTELSMIPKITVPLDEKRGLATLKLLDKLEELDEVQRVHSNADFPDSVLQAYQAASA
ncbi:MAG: YebC/PmpR family DNA-binding transcriptional regulator [Chloroflexi bacterium]|nr:YebC/PmpR family DNA-binding transcriptional regulator [Chloroflexota bacterium]